MFEPAIRSADRRAAGDADGRDWPFVWRSILIFWGFNVVYVVVQAVVTGERDKLFDPHRLVPFAFGVGVTLLLWLALRASAGMGLARRLVVAACASVPAAVAVTTFTVATVYLFDPAMAEPVMDASGFAAPSLRQEFLARAPRLIADESFNSFFFFFAWGAFYVAVSSGRRLRAAEGRATEFERLAQSSQLQALRYQINPHFLFNTLNSLSSLVMTQRTDEAEAMILSLSDFLRSTLTMDPAADVSLAQEIALQSLYLDIERVRFPDRLTVVIDVPAELERARVPALLLQPIVENVIKYGVARTPGTVTLSINASRWGGRLTIVVEDDAAAPAAAVKTASTKDPSSAKGGGVGLANVRQRLFARYGGQADCTYGATPQGGFKVSMTMPLVTE